ncbi:MAG: hypothetical protein JW829_18225 [Pirellulales bacterium]|nr:hypothetical protein [Pirellulales bacterium]
MKGEKEGILVQSGSAGQLLDCIVQGESGTSAKETSFRPVEHAAAGVTMKST